MSGTVAARLLRRVIGDAERIARANRRGGLDGWDQNVQQVVELNTSALKWALEYIEKLEERIEALEART